MFIKGKKVKCIYGKVWTVLRQEGTTVEVYESNATIHATKLVGIK